MVYAFHKWFTSSGWKEIRSGVNVKLEISQDTQKSKGFQLSKTQFMECKFSKSRNREKGMILLNGQKILKSGMFSYLGSIINKTR